MKGKERKSRVTYTDFEVEADKRMFLTAFSPNLKGTKNRMRPSTPEKIVVGCSRKKLAILRWTK